MTVIATSVAANARDETDRVRETRLTRLCPRPGLSSPEDYLTNAGSRDIRAMTSLRPDATLATILGQSHGARG